tara:strand:+ start:65389 stop:65739 length:351 start_codon:yes stop_codon:yes gene_type:complete
MEKFIQETISSFNALEETYEMDLFDELVSIFSSQKEAFFNSLQTDQNFNDTELRQQAHKIKSSARNVGAKKVGSLLEEIEKRADGADYHSKLEQIETEYQLFIKIFNEWKKNRGQL